MKVRNLAWSGAVLLCTMIAFVSVSQAWSPCIYFTKSVSVDGGNTYYAADTEETAQVVGDKGANYIIAVRNCGELELNNGVVEDIINFDELGFDPVEIGDLATRNDEIFHGEIVILYDGVVDLDNIVSILPDGRAVTLEGLEYRTIVIPELDQPDRCDGVEPPSALLNTAKVTVDYKNPYDPPYPEGTIMAEDPAWVKCKEPPSHCSIGDFVFEDANRNGCQDPEERGIEGVEVTLYEDCGNLINPRTITTNADGYYEFTVDCSGSYKVQFGDAGDIYSYTDQNAICPDEGDHPDPENDSDCSKVDGFSGCITFPDPVNFPKNPTIDCGYVCEGEIGDYVWSDDDENGCQDDSETGIEGVEVTLFETCGDPMNPKKTTTNADGLYEFTGLCPGQYLVEFDDTLPNTRPGQICDDDPSDEKDSNCGDEALQCVTLNKDNPEDLTIDCGKVPPPLDCNLAIDKKCRVETPTDDFEKCAGKLQQFTVIWMGDTPIQVSGVPNNAPGGEVNPGDAVTFMGPFKKNDVVVKLTGATPNQSKFHVSCSDREFNSPDDCGKPAGNGKKNERNFNNSWEVAGFVDKKGLVLDCSDSSSNGGFTDACEFDRLPANCETFGKPKQLTLRYSGSGPVTKCTDNAASREGKKPPFCRGNLDPDETVEISIKKGSVEPATVAPGQEFTISGFGADTVIALIGGDGRKEIDRFHTSCSAALQLGDVFGSLELVGWDGKAGSVSVTYQYSIENNGDSVSDVVLEDKVEGVVRFSAGPFDLAGGETTVIEFEDQISDTTTNSATVTGQLDSGQQCAAMDSVTVTGVVPVCEAAIAFDKLDADKIKSKIKNVSSIKATIDTFVLNFSASYGAIKEIKLGKDKIFKAKDSETYPNGLGPGEKIMSSDWTAYANKREINPGKTEKLEVKFTDKGDRGDWEEIADFGKVTFQEGCEVQLPPLSGCALGKPTGLVFEYTGGACEEATTNFQKGKFECKESGVPLGALVDVEMTKDAGKISVDIVGSTVKIFYNDREGKKLPSEIKYLITGTAETQSQALHTSCSKPLEVGDQFGAFRLDELIREY